MIRNAMATLAFVLASHTAAAEPMTVPQLEELIQSAAELQQRQGNLLYFRYGEVNMILVQDTSADRMRIMAPVGTLDGLGLSELRTLMEANFHTALDARYAVSNGRVYALFLHPLSSLTETETVAAMDQVAGLVLTYGRGFSSTGTGFRKSE